MSVPAGKRGLIFGGALAVVLVLVVVVVYFGVIRSGDTPTQAASVPVIPPAPASLTPSPTGTPGPAPTGLSSPGQIEASLGLPTTDSVGDVAPEATPGLAGGSLMETTARVFAARFSVYAPLSSTSSADWVASWSPIAVPAFASDASDLIQQYYKFTSDQGVKATNPRVTAAVHVWSGIAPDGPAQLWRVTVQRTLVAIDGSTRADTEQTVSWDIELRDVARPLVIATMTADPHRTAPPRED
ncbi:hypothetical protein GCM10009765_17910 [Fodinicola feengrottensis]|uniref:Uncharacterized protein n=1 Tax=Fodinicola feengrottensis TaxID=435914 RepID=A0ABN2GC56_9ACTN